MAAAPAPLSIRAYRLSDWPRLCQIHDRARLDELQRSASADAFRNLARTAHSEGLFDGRLDVAEVDGVVRGFVAFQRASLNWLYVDPDSYRQGVGRALLRHALAHSGPVVSTQALLGNDPAIALYRSEGFVEIERRQGRLGGCDEFVAVGLILELRR
ncbi:GNAT family N-acetyltransferase [Lysobacter enzymogenes]|uniref:N-acetyltransferase n=1 Tax=Lysobacter enzymogenes TaxID=69 RepID=A0A3N2RKG2_LYSEN|nr:N-acetyltransferase [Lysobacter enzymogenes]QQQ02100.1 GNAT family N-acetyltransferase [Lysobacter enzymogenes]ROU07874.1 N-acetyltransferase [Lysobacter enzymogenes]